MPFAAACRYHRRCDDSDGMIMKARIGLTWMILVLVAAAALSARLLNYDLLFTDEYLSMRNSGLMDGPLTYAGVLDRVVGEDLGGMGILYQLELKLWGDATGATPFSVRAFSWLWGLIGIAWLYRLGVDMFNRRVGLYAAVLLAFSAFYLDYLHEARAYTQFAALTIIAVWLYWRLAQQTRPRWGWYVALALSITALVYTHYLALSIGFVLGLVHLFNFRPQRRWWLTLLALAVGGLAYLPWLGNTLIVAQRGLAQTSRQATSMTAGEFVPLFFATFANANVVLLLLLAYFLLRRWRPVRLQQALASPLLLILCWLLVAGALLVLVNARVPFMVHLRYTLFLFPALALLGALGVQAANWQGMPTLPVLGVAALVGAGQTFNPSFVGDLFGQVYRAPAAGLYQAMDIVRARGDADRDALLVHIARPDFEPFQLFPNGYLFRDLPVRRAEQFELMNLSLKTDDNSYLRDAEPVFEGIEVVWTAIVPGLPTTNRSDVVNYILSTQYAHCETVLDRPDVRLDLYARVPDDQEQAATLTTAAGETFSVAAIRQQVTDDGLHVVLGWQDGALPRGQYSYSLRLQEATGSILQAVDAGIPDQRPLGCTGDTLAWHDLPAGDYDLVLYVYNWQTQTPVNADPILLETLTKAD